MKILFIGGVFAKENEPEVLKNAKAPVEYSANIFQEKLIAGFYETGIDFQVLSAPFIGSFPNASKKMRFTGFSVKQDKYQYVPFNNVWGLRNFSRARALKKALRSFIREDTEEKLIVVYSPHTPFLDAAVYAKKKDPRIKICLYVPDLPQFMNLNEKKSLLYRVGKKLDIRKFNQLNKNVDSYVLLTDAMREKIDIHDRPYVVVEGIVTQAELRQSETERNHVIKDENIKYVVYTGKLYHKFGITQLVDAFMLLSNSNYRLVLCGGGDAERYISAAQEKDSRILFMGQVSAEQAKEWVYRADILVNPRGNGDEYTKYSFPSKNIEYLVSGNPVVGYRLSGMPAIYQEFMIIPEMETSESLAFAIEKGLTKELIKKSNFYTYCRENLTEKTICARILSLNGF